MLIFRILIEFDNNIGQGQCQQLGPMNGHDILGRTDLLNKEQPLILQLLKGVGNDIGSAKGGIIDQKLFDIILLHLDKQEPTVNRMGAIFGYPMIV